MYAVACAPDESKPSEKPSRSYEAPKIDDMVVCYPTMSGKIFIRLYSINMLAMIFVIFCVRSCIFRKLLIWENNIFNRERVFCLPQKGKCLYQCLGGRIGKGMQQYSTRCHTNKCTFF